jgi:hypothetical protein
MEDAIVVFEAVIWGWICSTYAGDYLSYAIGGIIVLGLLDALANRKDRP